MPPQISDDEGSDSDQLSPRPFKRGLTPKKASTPKLDASVKKSKDTRISAGKKEVEQGKKLKAEAVVEDDEQLQVESEEDEEDDEVGEGEYVVEKILNHTFDPDNNDELRFEVKWEGYEKKSDRTWEPEESLESAPLILNAYLDKFGGKDALIAAYEELKAKQALEKEEKNVKKRPRTSTVTGTPKGEGSAKKAKKNDSTPAGVQAKAFTPPQGSWEDHVVAIDACEGKKGDVIVYLTWKAGVKSQHTLATIYKRCPQAMLRFYESHLVFKRADTADAE